LLTKIADKFTPKMFYEIDTRRQSHKTFLA